MSPNPILGIFFHAVGGFAAGSFYSPLKKLRSIAWESAWLLMGVAAWLGAPWFAAWMTTPHLDEVISESIAFQPTAVTYAILFGFLWGFGNLTYGMAARYLGIALGGSIAVAFCMICGTLEPPIRKGTAGSLFATPSGWAILSGISLCTLGIALCGEAGRRRDIELKEAAATSGAEQFQFWKGLLVAVFAGILSGCFAIGLDRGAPIADIALAKGADPLYKNNPILIAVLLGGFASNSLSCLLLNVRNGTLGDSLRFTRKDNTLYAIALDRPNETLVTKSLGKESHKDTIRSISMLGDKNQVSWKQVPEQLEISIPQKLLRTHAWVFKIEFADPAS